MQLSKLKAYDTKVNLTICLHPSSQHRFKSTTTGNAVDAEADQASSVEDTESSADVEQGIEPIGIALDVKSSASSCFIKTAMSLFYPLIAIIALL